MLRDSPLDVVLLATGLDVAKDFSNKLGLHVIDGNEQSLTLSCGGGSRVIITKSETGTSDSQAQAQWRVHGLAAELSDLRFRGVKARVGLLKSRRPSPPLSDWGELSADQSRVNQEAERIQQLALLHQPSQNRVRELS